MRIGITFFVYADSAPHFDIWSNGIVQNIFFLYRLFKASPLVSDVLLINCGDGEQVRAELLAGQEVRMERFNDAAQQLDVLIELGAQIKPSEAAAVRARGGVVIAFKCGNDYVIDTERIVFNKSSGVLFNGTVFDEVWTNPQHANTCQSYWGVTLRAPVRVVPHLWDPYFVSRGAAALLTASGGAKRFSYEAAAKERLHELTSQLPSSLGGDNSALHQQQLAAEKAGVLQKRVSNFEPNINMVKTSLTPILLCEAAHRLRPDLFASYRFFNTAHIKEHVTFASFIAQMQIVRDGKATFEPRYVFPQVVGEFTDIVVAHQWENELNYLYYDTLYGHYPLVHNAAPLKNVGYYYEGFDAHAGAQALIRAATEHDAKTAEYAEQCDAFLATRSLSQPANVAAHIEPLVAMLASKRAAMSRAHPGLKKVSP